MVVVHDDEIEIMSFETTMGMEKGVAKVTAAAIVRAAAEAKEAEAMAKETSIVDLQAMENVQ